MNTINKCYFQILLRELLAKHGPVPFRIKTPELSSANAVAWEESKRKNIIQVKDLSYCFDAYLREHGLMFVFISNGEWEIRNQTFGGYIALPKPLRTIFTARHVTHDDLIEEYLSGGTKCSTNETKSLEILDQAQAFSRFYEVEGVSYRASTGRTRTTAIDVDLGDGTTIQTESLQAESDGVVAFRRCGMKVFSPVEAKESVKPLWWRQLFYPYWDRVNRHPDAEIILTVVLKATNSYYLYALKFENHNPDSWKVLDSAEVFVS